MGVALHRTGRSRMFDDARRAGMRSPGVAGVIDALAMAVAARDGDRAVAGVITHGDRGSQYTSNDYLARRLRPSVGRTGVCWNNAVAESFWESVKRECVQGARSEHCSSTPTHHEVR